MQEGRGPADSAGLRGGTSAGAAHAHSGRPSRTAGGSRAERGGGLPDSAAWLAFAFALSSRARPFSPGSVPSLVAGLLAGGLAGYGAYRVSNDRRDVKVSLFTAFVLATVMGVRFKRSKKIMPAGLVAGLSLLMILRLVLLLL
ncbi:transmembrane protein 14A [Octodon degus]|uniref:Transmembrane protein 14A n=1 Tax=Octodon degus TaxID=10160 RepID=A0A6P6E632_OCTDE|nr:transmembrane protein 14A [Octodon degus]